MVAGAAKAEQAVSTAVTGAAKTEQAVSKMVVTERVGDTVVGNCSRWNIGEGAVNKAHHNWHKIFGDKKPSLADIEPYVKKAL